MGTTLFTCCSYSSLERGISGPKIILSATASRRTSGLVVAEAGNLNRRSVVISGVSLALAFPGEGIAAVKQGLLAGRIPGLSEPDEQDRLEDLPQTR